MTLSPVSAVAIGREGAVASPWLAARVVVDEVTGCWVWTGATNRDGYGSVHSGGRWYLAHRLAWLLSGRVLVDGLELDHLCGRHACVRPSHLDQVDHRTNMRRWAVSRRRARRVGAMTST